MQIISLILSIGIIIWFWSWFLNQVFSRASKSGYTLRKSLLQCGILVFLLFIYEKALTLLGFNASFIFSHESLTLPSILLFLIYGFLIVIGIALLFGQSKNKKIWLQIISAILLLWGFSLNRDRLHITNIALYYILAAATEENFKFTLSHNQSEASLLQSPSNLLLFSLLASFSFSVIENLFALGTLIAQGEHITTGILLGRGLITAIIHLVATGSIALIIMKSKKIWSLTKYLLALTVGFVIHATYNLLLISKMQSISIMLGIGAGIALSYLIFHLDEIYE